MRKLSPHLELVVTLLVVWVVGAAFIFDIPGFEEEPVVAKHEALVAAEPAVAKAEAAPVAAPTSEPRAIDGAPQRMLMLGDSMIDELMLRLADYAHHNGHSLAPAIWYGASTVHWSQSGRIDQLLAQHDPTFVFVVIGSAELTTRRLDRRRVAIERILDKLAGRRLIWIGPPSWTEDTGIDGLLAELVGEGRYFRSSAFFRDRDLPRKKDGIHPTREASAAWLDAVMQWTMMESATPIRLDTPTMPAPRPVAQVFPPPGR